MPGVALSHPRVLGYFRGLHSSGFEGVAGCAGADRDPLGCAIRRRSTNLLLSVTCTPLRPSFPFTSQSFLFRFPPSFVSRTPSLPLLVFLYHTLSPVLPWIWGAYTGATDYPLHVSRPVPQQLDGPGRFLWRCARAISDFGGRRVSPGNLRFHFRGPRPPSQLVLSTFVSSTLAGPPPRFLCLTVFDECIDCYVVFLTIASRTIQTGHNSRLSEPPWQIVTSCLPRTNGSGGMPGIYKEAAQRHP